MRIRSLAGAVLVTLVLGLTAGTASAAPFTVDIKAGGAAETIGTATIDRVDDGDGTETLHITVQSSEVIRDSYVCLSDSAFTERVSPGQCPYAQGRTGTTATYVIDLGDTYVGADLHIQLHLTLPGASAYAGWQPGSPFFGELPVGPPGSSTPVPVGTLGMYGLALGLGVVLLASLRVAARRG